MNIYIAESSLNFGGQELIIMKMIKGLEKNNHTVTLLTSKNAEIYTKAKENNIKVKSISFRFGSIISSFINLNKWVREEQIDMIHTNSGIDSSMIWLCRWAFPKKVSTMRMRHCANPITNPSSYKTLTHKISFVTYHLVEHAKTFKDPKTVFYTPPGIDILKYKNNPIDKSTARNKLNIPEEAIVIGNVGRLCDDKDQATLIDAFSKIQKSYPNTFLIIVGQDQGEKENLEKQINKLGLEASVKIFPFSKKIEDFYKAMDCFILTSVLEGFGLVVVEAMASGIPVITTKSGGPNEIIREGKEEGIIVELKDSNSISNEFGKLWKDSELKEKIIQNGYKRVEDFSEESMIRSLEKAYSE